VLTPRSWLHVYLPPPSLGCSDRSFRRARSFVGFPVTKRTLPNAGHRALAALHNYDPCFRGHVAQNVDGLFQKAGIFERGFVELHGTIHAVECLDCRGVEDRDRLQARLEAYNPGWADALVVGEYRADGDADLDDGVVAAFRVPPCVHCGNHAIIPRFVFMGGAVPKDIVAKARRMVDTSSAVLICGSTVTTYSAYSLVRRAKEAGGKVAIVNYGETRADSLADLKIEANLSDTLVRVAQERLPHQSLDADPDLPIADENDAEGSRG
jgi:NAD+-dependent protein deacetylase sirtuin 4